MALQSDTLNELIVTVPDPVPKNVLYARNNKGSWAYGYDETYDIVVISRDGTLGEVVEINGLRIGLPKRPKYVYKRMSENKNQFWERKEYPKELSKIQSIFQWNDMPSDFKDLWVDYIEKEFERRDQGYWFYNNGRATYITGSHYMYLQWTKIDVGYPEYREANRALYIFWEACKADPRSYGMIYLKIRRSGFSFMASEETVNIATLARDARIGILSKTGPDAKKMFTDKVVPISLNYPFFFKPLQDGMDRPKTELAYRVPASRITRKNMNDALDDSLEGLDTTIDWRNTGDNSYDGEKLKLLIQDECYAPETKILMADMSFRAIEDICVGDRVMVDGGKVKNVVKTTSGETKRYLVRQPYGEDYVVTENHRLVFYEYGKGEVVMTPVEYLSSSGYRKQHLTRVVSKGVDTEDIFDGMPPYLLGLWLGDGRKNAMSILVNNDKQPELLHYLGRIAENIGVPFDLKSRPGCVEFRFKGINEELRRIGVYNNKHIPEQYLKSSMDTRLQLLAGLIDSDGHSDKKKGTVGIAMSREDMVRDIRFLALSCGLSASNVKEKVTNYGTKCYRVSISGDLSILPILSDHKSFEGYEPSSRGRRNKVSVEPLDVGPYVGIQVDGEDDDERKLILSDFTVSLNSGKWVKPDNILNNWKVTKTCLRLGKRVVGKCMMGSTVNALNKGGGNFKKLYSTSDVRKRNANGQTESGLYALFIPMEWNFEGFIDMYGMPVLHTPEQPTYDSYGDRITQGALEYWTNEVESLKSDSASLNEFYRQFPRTEAHAFRDEAKSSLFNLTKIYQQTDYNDSIGLDQYVSRGRFMWENGIKDTRVQWVPDKNGNFLTSWIPPARLRNNVLVRNGVKMPGNEHIGAFGCDSYDISGTVDGRGSNGALHGLTLFNMDDAPSNEFFLEYVARPQTAELFFEDVLMALVFYGMPVLAENNKPRLLYHLKNRGYRRFSLNRPDKIASKLSKTERELGGIPNTSEDVKQAHAAAIESYIEKYVGIDTEGLFREDDAMGTMPFQRTLDDWARFDINNRTKYDASISSGLAIMATQKSLYVPQTQKNKISVTFARYNNGGTTSELLR